MLQTTIRNLVSNAVKFTPKGGKVTLSANATVKISVEISIKDSGIGMSQAIIDHLFLLQRKHAFSEILSRKNTLANTD